jgi:hypothetical protein
LRRVLAVVAQHDQQRDAVLLCESEGSRNRVVVPRSVAHDADDHLLRTRKFDTECGAQAGPQRSSPSAILREGLALVEELNHLGHLGGYLIDADRVIGQCVMQLAKQLGCRHEIGCLRR